MPNNPLPLAYRSIDSAPKNGKAVRLLLRDGFGEYPFEPCKWDEQKNSWVNAKTGSRIVNTPIGWSTMSPHKEVDYGEKA